MDRETFLLFFLFFISLSGYSQKRVTDTSYYSNGQIEEKSEFDKETKRWITKGYYMSGAIASVKMRDTAYRFTDDFQVFFPNGHLAYSRTYDRNILSGIFAEYYQSGQLKRKGKYFNNFKTGKWTEFFPNGLKKSEGKYFLTGKDSAIDMENDFDIKKETFRNRICYDTISYPDVVPAKLPDSNEKSEMHTDAALLRTDVALTICSLKDGVWKYWNEQGALILEESYQEGVLIKK